MAEEKKPWSKLDLNNPEIEKAVKWTRESPGAWHLVALQLKTAADRLDWLTRPIQDDEPVNSMVPVFRMLMARSFENLLKGILAAQHSGQLPPKFYIHNLSELATLAMPSLSASDKNLLENLQPYADWAGRFPYPKETTDSVVLGHKNVEHDAEIDLWRRLVEELRKVGWIWKADGRKLQLT